MTLTVRQRVEEQETGLVGRETSPCCAALGTDGPLVVFVHGIGGVGKSALLDGSPPRPVSTARSSFVSTAVDRAHCTRFPRCDLDGDWE
jgi:hypothetical protein